MSLILPLHQFGQNQQRIQQSVEPIYKYQSLQQALPRIPLQAQFVLREQVDHGPKVFGTALAMYFKH